MTWSPIPPPRSRPHWAVLFLLGVSFVVFLLFLGFFVYLFPPPGANCNDPWVYCPTGPGATPLGTALAVSNGTGACPAGNGSSPSECAYSFTISYPSGGLSPSDLRFVLLGPNSAPLNTTFSVALTNPEGGWIGIWNSSSGGWAPATGGGCASTHCLSDPLVAGESFLLRSLPGGGLPFSHQGDQLQVDSSGGGFAGWVDAPID